LAQKKAGAKKIAAKHSTNAKSARARRSSSIVFDTITLEGGLISSAMLARIAARGAGNQTEADYAVPKGLTLRDEIARYFRIGAAFFKDFASSPTPSVSAAITLMEGLLGQVFGFADVGAGEGVAMAAKKGRVPVVVVPPSPEGERREDDLDRASAYLSAAHGAEGGRRRSAASALQDWLNHTDQALWGFCTNGDQLRLMRNNASLTRPAFVEVNLRQIFETENFADFAAVWQLFHSTRFGAPGTPVTDCALERWREAGASEGLVARDRLRDGVETALLAFGNGFLAHPENSTLRARVTSAELPLPEFFGELLRLVYRLIFLLVAEDRGLLHPPGASPSATKLYADGYSLSTLRERAVRRTAWDQHYDRWEGLLITFAGLAQGQAKLALPALGGLFDNVIPDLEKARLSNRALMEAVYRLAWLKDDASLVPVNWRDMETEELGSVYESLLELTPILVDEGRGICFAEGDEAKGNQRKTTGSYYTPDSLVQTLLDSALDPVLDRVESESNDKIQGLLAATVIDPACGSGHFLLAAARRIAARVARARTDGVASAQDYRHALRDVVRSCVHGVDRNPMAVELTKVALWIETVEPGKPLGFLDASILCGDSLLGVFDLEVLREGIPDAAYKPLSGDEKDAAKYFDRRNKAERDGQGTLDFTGGKNSLPAAPPLAASLRAVRNLPEDTTGEIAEKKKRLAAAKSERQLWSWRVAADLYVAAFLLSKKDAPRDPGSALVPTTDHVWRTLSGGQVYGPLLGQVREIADNARAFHWPLEFPDVLASGGFDVVIGNPPWEMQQLDPIEFFSNREPRVAQAANASVRQRLISDLKTSNPLLFLAYDQACSENDKRKNFLHSSERFPLTSYGRLNLAPLFAELLTQLVNGKGRCGVILPTGIATDSFNQYFFNAIVSADQLRSLFSFLEVRDLFHGTEGRQPFCLLTLSGKEDRNQPSARFSFNLLTIQEMRIDERVFELTLRDFEILNPNTKTCPVFQTRADAELTRRIYERVPVLINEPRGENPWALKFELMFMMNSASGLFRTRKQLLDEGCELSGNHFSGNKSVFIPLYEAKMIHQFDHRFGTCLGLTERPKNTGLPGLSPLEHQNPSCLALPWYWISTADLTTDRQWHLGFRNTARSSDERTFMLSVIPWSGVGHKTTLISTSQVPLCLIANMNSIVFDYCVRQKLGGTDLTHFYVKQFPTLPPSAYRNMDVLFIAPRVTELVWTAWDLHSFAKDLWREADWGVRSAIERQWNENRNATGGHSSDSLCSELLDDKCPLPPFKWNDDRRSLIRAELDAWYARAYGLTRDELRYVLDPADVMGENYPSETFRVLKNNEIKEFGEYRTRRLVLEAWDRMEAGDLK
jgi:hypothetical protein